MLEVYDSREVVGVLVALADRGIDILEADVSAEPLGFDRSRHGTKATVIRHG